LVKITVLARYKSLNICHYRWLAAYWMQLLTMNTCDYSCNALECRIDTMFAVVTQAWIIHYQLL